MSAGRSRATGVSDQARRHRDRLIDTAQVYGNDKKVGDAIAHYGVARSALFITIKRWINNGEYEKAKQSLVESRRTLQTDCIDFVLIHPPFNAHYGTYRTMEAPIGQAGCAIGLPDFYPDRLVDLCRFAEIPRW